MIRYEEWHPACTKISTIPQKLSFGGVRLIRNISKKRFYDKYIFDYVNSVVCH